MQNNYEILELFPTPVYTTMIPEKFSKILPWFYKQEMLDTEVDSTNYGSRSKDSYILNQPECNTLREFILENITEYGTQLGYDYESYKLSQSWVSYKHPGQHHTMHSHPNSLISGVFYFGEGSQDTPAIKFHNMISGVNSPYIQAKEIKDKRNFKYGQKEFSIEFTPGLLLLFPSYLHHSVPVNKSKLTRCSIAFNVVPTIGLGDESNLTELKF
ncbi:MAG TPA: hypothetical protein DDW91_17615 [Shewanella frigidimarina]|nr:hypothetical protein [Shewanella frigidimarina]